MTKEQETYYIDKVCSICSKNENCNKDKFISTNIYERLSIKCLDYEYKNK